MKNIADTSTPVVVVQFLLGLAHGALGVMRSLGRLGVPVYAVAETPRAFALSSRYCRRKFICDVPHTSSDKAVEYMLSVGRKIGQRSILIPLGTDDSAIFVADHAAALKEWFLIPNQAPGLVRSLSNKKEMYFLAKKFRIPTAETIFPQSRKDVADFLKTGAFPVMLKGIDGLRLKKRTGKKMVIARTGRELMELYDAMEDPENPNLMLQEYIPGGDDTIWMFNGYFNENSDCLAAFTGKKIRQFPPYTGSTSLGVCLPNETIEKATKEFMKAIGYKGILDIGYRYDERDGRYKVLDINPRLGGTFRLFVAENGMDVVRALYLDLTGQSLPPVVPVPGRKWIVEDSDIVSCLRYRRDSKLTVGEWLKSLRGIEEGAYFASDDLLPFLLMSLRGAETFIRRAFGGQDGAVTQAIFSQATSSPSS
jgi:D-aspartate ligase